MYSRTSEKRRIQHITVSSEQIRTALANPGCLDSPKMGSNCERKVRREIANSNERRRMQSINAGFESLKTIIPQQGGEKLSKAAILQQTANYVSILEEEKSCLLSQNTQLKKRLNQFTGENIYKDSPPPKRKKRDTESSDEGIGLCMSGGGEYDDEELMIEAIKKQVVELRMQLERERTLRSILEERTRMLHGEVMYPQHVRIFADRVQQHIDSLGIDKLSPGVKEPRLTILTEEAPMTTKLSAPEKHSTAVVNTTTTPHSMSQRNLETIVQAIRHLEGDCVMPTMTTAMETPQPCARESQQPQLCVDINSRLLRENSADSGHGASDAEEIKSSSKTTDSPKHATPTLVVPDLPINLARLPPVAINTSSVSQTISNYTSPVSPPTPPHNSSYLTSPEIVKDRFPVSIHLLHQPVISQYYATSIAHKC